jgi:predicted DNA-binding transcriptional regulator YafY
MRKAAAETIKKAQVTDLNRLSKAATTHEVAVFMYRKQKSNEYERRAIEVEHIRTADSTGEPYVHGFDLMRQEFRNFHLSRIQTGSVKVAR